MLVKENPDRKKIIKDSYLHKKIKSKDFLVVFITSTFIPRDTVKRYLATLRFFHKLDYHSE